MNYASPEKLAQLADSHRRLQDLLLHKVKVLKERLDNFIVLDADGNPVGEVRNLVLYKRRLHLVIVQPDVHRSWRFILLHNHLVKRISMRDRIILTHVTHTDVNYLPEQRPAARVSLSQSATAHAGVAVPVRQLPALLMPDPTQCLEAAERAGSLLETLAFQTQDEVNSSPMTESPAMPKVVADIVNADMVNASVEVLPTANRVADSTPLTPSYPAVATAKPVPVRVSERLS
jgi:hypothetical protein